MTAATATPAAAPAGGPTGGEPFRPAWITSADVDDLARGLAAPPRPDGADYERALVVVLRRCEPLVVVDVALRGGCIDGADLQEAVRGAHPPAFAVPGTGDDLGAWVDAAGDALPMMSVVLCTRDRPDEAAGAIDQLLRLDYARYEVVVVDNAPSGTRTAAVVERAAAGDARVRYVLEPVPGLANARNAGLRAAHGTVVAFTDDDIRVAPWWLQALARGFARDEGVVCVTGSVFTATLETAAQQQFEQAVGTTTKWGLVPRLFDADEHRASSALYPYQLGIYGGGGNAAFDRAWLVGTGGFDGALGAGTVTHGGEDLDAFLRVVASGRALAYEPAALVWHDHVTDHDAIRSQAFAYGVGLGAVLAKIACTPTHTAALLRRAGVGLRYLLSPTSAKNLEKPTSYPRMLTTLELAGICWGPFAYVRSRRRATRRGGADPG